MAKNRQGLALSSSPIRTLTVGSGISPNPPKKASRTLDSGRGLYRRLRFSLTPKNAVAVSILTDNQDLRFTISLALSYFLGIKPIFS